jgi:hypothetical protein
MAEHRVGVEGEAADAEEEGTDVPAVNVREVAGERRVFTEGGNPDGWISSELTVSVQR